MTTKSADPLVANNPSAPANDADKVYVPAASFGVSWHDAVPVLSVVPGARLRPVQREHHRLAPHRRRSIRSRQHRRHRRGIPKVTRGIRLTANAVGAAGAVTVTVAAGELAGW